MRRHREAPLLGLLLLVGAAGCGGGPDTLAAGSPPEPNGDGLGVTVDLDRRELVLEMAPVDLPAGAAHHGHGMGRPPTQYGTVPVDAWMHGYRVELVDAQGRAVPQELLHHVNIIAPDRRELFSPIMQRIGAAGHETAPVELPRLLGYPLERGDRVMLSGMMHNPTSESYYGVRARVRLPLSSRNRRLPVIRVYPFYLDVMPPASLHNFDLPPGRSERSWEGGPAMSGRILGMGGHVHRHALELRLEDVTEGKVIWRTEPVHDEDGDVTGMPQDLMVWRLGLPVHADHVYRLVVVYDNPTGETIPGGGMGALGGVFVPAGGVAWPAVDTMDPDYRLDVQITESGEDPTAEPDTHTHTDSAASSHAH